MRHRPSVNADAARLVLLLLIILAFALRLYHLDYQSLWRDEVDAILFARRDLTGLRPLFLRPGHNGPLYYLTLHFWIRLAGDSEFSVRFFSLVCGVLTVPMIFVLAKRWVGRTGGLLAALLSATSPYLVWYSQEAKMYALLFLLSMVATHIYLLALERDRVYLWFSYLISIGVSMYVHLLAVLIIPVHFLLFFVGWPRHRRALRWWLITFAVLLLPYVPLARWQVPLLVSPFTTGHQFYSLHQILAILLFAFSLNSAPYQGLLPIALFVFLLLAGMLLYRRAVRQPGSLSLKTLFRGHQESISLSLYLFLPIVLIFLISLGMPIFTDRYLITVLPAYLLLLACGLLAVKQRSSRQAVLCVGLVLVSNLYMLWRQEHTKIKSDFRSAAAYVEEDGRGDLMIFLIRHGRLVFDYYWEEPLVWVDPPYTNGGIGAGEVARVMESSTAGYHEVWFIVSEAELWDSRGLVKRWLDEHGMLLEHRSFARVEAYLYSLQP